MKVKLGDLCENSQEKFNIEASQLIDYIDIASVDNVTKTIVGYNTFVCCEAPSRARKLVRQNDIIISTVRPNLNSVALVNVETPNTLVVSTGFCVLRPKANVCPNYIFHFCKSKKFIDSLTKQATGASYPAVSDRIIKEEIIPSFSYEEQIAIAGTLDRVSHLLSLRHQQLEKLDLLVKSRFIEMFGDLIENTKHYEMAPLSQLLMIERGGSPRPIEKYITDSEDGVNWIKIGDAEEGSIYITKTKEKIIAEGTKKSRHVEPGDFLLSNSMSFGKPYILTIDGYIHDGWLVLRDRDNVFNKLFLHTMLSSDYAKGCFESMAAGSVVKNLNKDLVGRLLVPVPSMEEQEQFAAFLKQVDKSKFVIKQSIEKLELLKSKLMQDYFG